MFYYGPCLVDFSWVLGFGILGSTTFLKVWSSEFWEARIDPILNFIVLMLASQIYIYYIVKYGSFSCV